MLPVQRGSRGRSYGSAHTDNSNRKASSGLSWGGDVGVVVVGKFLSPGGSLLPQAPVSHLRPAILGRYAHAQAGCKRNFQGSPNQGTALSQFASTVSSLKNCISCRPGSKVYRVGGATTRAFLITMGRLYGDSYRGCNTHFRPCICCSEHHRRTGRSEDVELQGKEMRGDLQDPGFFPKR